MFPDPLLALAEQVLGCARSLGLCIATAESCTGGLIGGLLTEIPGSSDAYERGFITYSNLAKTQLLGVPAALIAAEGAVSEAVAWAMAQGALAHSAADVSVAVTGVAGPGGGTAAKPVGLVHLAAARKGRQTYHEALHFGAIGRSQIRLGTAEAALKLLLRMMQQ